jgi:hypothetical protein
MEYEIKVRLTGKADDYTKLKRNLGEAVNKKILPDVQEFLTGALLYRNMRGLGTGSKTKPLDEFRAQHAGLITLGILDHVNKKYIDFGDTPGGQPKSSATVTKGGSSLIVDFKFTLKDLSPDKIGISITPQSIVAKTFNPTFINDIFKKAAAGLKDK